MQRVTLWQGAVYQHVQATRVGVLCCPACRSRRVSFHSTRRRTVEYPDVQRPTYLVLPVAKYACDNPACVLPLCWYATCCHGAVQSTACLESNHGAEPCTQRHG